MSQSVNRVVKNTGILYIKMLVTMVVTLYTTRMILYALGESDFGIYNLIAGVIAMLAFLNTAMSVSTQRFLSFYQGVGDFKSQKSVFATSVLIHFGLALSLSVIIEIVGIFLFDGFFNIPTERLEAAKIMYHFMVVTIFFSIISVPFVSSINAHEEMKWIALIEVLDTFLKLAVALSLVYSTVSFDRLITYALSLSVVAAIAFLSYLLVCLRRYDECTLKITKDLVKKNIFLKITNFAGWNLFGAICGMGRNQGIAIILNIFYGTIVNAAYGIANQVAGQMSFFSVTMLRALNPQIMKSEGENNRKKMLRLSMIGSKFGFFLLAIVGIPCILTMDSLLSLWLKDIPTYTGTFCQLVIIAIIVNQLTIGLQSSFQAVGKVKIYQSIVGTLLLLNLPLAYFLLKQDMPVYSVLLGYIAIEALACCIRIVLASKIIGLSIKTYIQKVIYPVIISIIPSILLNVVIISFVVKSINGFITTAILVVTLMLISVAFIWLWGLDYEEKVYIKGIFLKFKSYARK